MPLFSCACEKNPFHHFFFIFAKNTTPASSFFNVCTLNVIYLLGFSFTKTPVFKKVGVDFSTHLFYLFKNTTPASLLFKVCTLFCTYLLGFSFTKTPVFKKVAVDFLTHLFYLFKNTLRFFISSISFIAFLKTILHCMFPFW